MKKTSIFLRSLTAAWLLLALGGIPEVCAQTFKSNPYPVRISDIPRPTAPAELHITDLKFSDAMGNQNELLDAEEAVEVRFTLVNRGRGNAYRTRLQVESTVPIREVTYAATQEIGDLAAGQSRPVVLKLQASRSVASADLALHLTVKEANGFDSDPAVVRFRSEAFQAPLLAVADAVFTNNEGEGKLVLGKTVTLDLLIQNRGQGVARKTKIEIACPPQVFPAGGSTFDLGDMNPNDSKRITYEFFANKLYTGTDIGLQIKATESYGEYGFFSTQRISLEKSLAKTQTLQVAGQQTSKVTITDVALRADVDRNIPQFGTPNPNRYALVIGNEDYASRQTGLATESNVPFARNDAQVVRSYFSRTLGVPESQIDMKLDATRGEMDQAIDRLSKIIKNTEGKAEVMVYYAGHGLPDESGEAYLIPVDVSGGNVRMGVKLSEVYRRLTEFPAKRVTVFLDACFSGGARATELLAMARGVKIVPRSGSLEGNLVVFTATSGEQSALPFVEQQHGIFTYFLLKFWQERSGGGTFLDLANHLKSKVGLESVRTNNKEQNPQVLYSTGVADAWQSWIFNE
jgi:hypothetical protein